MKSIRIFLLVLIVLGLGLLFTQKIWVPEVVDNILHFESKNCSCWDGINHVCMLPTACEEVRLTSSPVITKKGTEAFNSKKSALEKVVKYHSYYSGVPIQECTAEGSIFFVIRYSEVDGGDEVYDSEGNYFAGCGGGLTVSSTVENKTPPLPEICSQLQQCKTVYSPSDKINTYGL
jgi:hypothetical protein